MKETGLFRLAINGVSVNVIAIVFKKKMQNNLNSLRRKS
jgi:hypothetical protein